jgi:hypothetical protein
MVACAAALFLSLAAAPLPAAHAQALTPDEQSFIDKHLPEFISTKVTRIADPALAKVFAAPFYKVEIAIKDNDGNSQLSDLTVARVGDKLVNVSSPSTDGDQKNLVAMLSPQFKLKSNADAAALQKALDLLFPPFNDEEKKAVKFSHKGADWTFIRGTFFEDKKGYIFTTKPDGAVASAKFMLKLP